MPRYPYPSEVYVSTEQVGTKYDRTWLLKRLKAGSQALLSSNTYNDMVKLEILAITGMLFFSGARISEVLQMKRCDIDKEELDENNNQWVTLTQLVEKRKQVYPHPVKKIPILWGNPETDFILNWILQWLGFVDDEIYKAIVNKQIKEDKIPDQPLFNYSRHAYYYSCAKFFRLNPHGFRKIAAQYMVVEKNMPLKTVQKLMGHSSLIALDYYINLRTDDIKRDLLNTMPKKEIE